MSEINTLLSQRTQKGELSSKMADMAKRSANGNLTSFSGVFSVVELNEGEKVQLETLLKNYAVNNHNVSHDLNSLLSITSEVKAINNQAAILHGERIKKAQTLLKSYREGAFTAWLMAAYGNRQTPYNFLQYYEFYESMPKQLRPRIEEMPRQAVYTLASREGSFEKKQQIVENYDGETKKELLETIREEFPLAKNDKRSENFGDSAIQGLEKTIVILQNPRASISHSQKKILRNLINQIISQLNLDL